MKWIAATAGFAFALAAPSAVRADWSPRQTAIIKKANEVLEAKPPAFMNSCKVADGKTRLDAADGRLKSIIPALEKALGEYAVYEIFVVRAPVYGPGALPPRRCKKLKRYAAEQEARMVRYEAAVSALVAEMGKTD